MLDVDLGLQGLQVERNHDGLTDSLGTSLAGGGAARALLPAVVTAWEGVKEVFLMVAHAVLGAEDPKDADAAVWARFNQELGFDQ